MAVIPGEGTKIAIESATPGTYTDLAQVVSISGTSPSVNAVETTSLQSTRHTYRPSKIPESGEVSFSIQYDPNDATQIILTGLMDTPVVKNWQITFADTLATHAKEVFAGFLTAHNKTGEEVDGNVTADITIKLTGTIVRTIGT